MESLVSLIFHVWFAVDHIRMWQNAAGPYNGRYCSVTKGSVGRRLVQYRQMLTITQEMGGAEGKVAYIGKIVSYFSAIILTDADTEGTFRPERIQEIAERFGGMRNPVSKIDAKYFS